MSVHNTQRGKLNYLDRRNNHVWSEAILISILNQTSSIEIVKPKAKTKIAQPFFPIQRIEFDDGDILEVTNIIEKRIRERMEFDMKNGVSEETALRRLKNGRIAEYIHLLTDIIREKGIFFNTRLTKGTNDVLIIEYIDCVFLNNETITKENIEKYGKLINKELQQRFGREKTVKIPNNDHSLQKYLNDSLSSF